MYEIHFIQKLISNNNAYIIDINDIGKFVCIDYNYISKKKFNPIKNCIVSKYLKNDKDFVIWIPSIDGIQTEWGTGNPSANLYIGCIY
jgi:cysteinyl-tRNA synthetase